MAEKEKQQRENDRDMEIQREQNRKTELPENFRENMKRLLKEAYPEYLESLSQTPVQGIRVNTGKISTERFLEICPFPVMPVPWTRNGFYVSMHTTETSDGRFLDAMHTTETSNGRFLVTKDAQVTRHPYYYAGLYYVQEPSAMLPAALLGAEPGERILDLCAAPGGKATELGSRLAGEGVLVANDISASRAKALLKNLEQHGVGNVLVCSEAPQKLQKIYPAYFDRILVDAPCSGEGMLRREPSMKKAYEAHGPAYYAPLQREIVEAAAAMLRPGGRMVYSTCTFSEQENEETVLALLADHPELRLVKTEVPGGEDIPEMLEGCVRLYPHRVKGEGHFAAVLEKLPGNTPDDADREEAFNSMRAIHERKGAGNTAVFSKEKTSGGTPGLKAPAQWQEFSGRYLKKEFAGWRFLSIKERLYALPPQADVDRRLRYLRTGLFLGECRQHGFEPSQALAMYLKQREVKNSISFAAEDTRTVRYLKGETVSLTAEEAAEADSGWILVCTDGFPLGWAKHSGGTLKNKYYAGWRMN